MSFLHLLQSEFLPEVFNKNGTELIECKIDEKTRGVDQFQSEVIFMSVVIRNGGEIEDIPLIIKCEMNDLKLREMIKSEIQFFNEITMYMKILPVLNKKDIVEVIFPKCYYGVYRSEESTFIILEDLRPLGFRLTEEKGFIDLTHLKLALTNLGRFHALSYAAKKDSPKVFFELARSLRERSWIEGSSTARFNNIITSCVQRAVDPVIRRGKHVKQLQKLLNRVKDNASVTQLMRDLVNPEEPLAVICHGDFCRNNMLFSYDIAGNPKEVKFFDIATARYASPAVDITFFLLLNGSREVRRAHWEELLSVYHQSLSTAIPGLEVPSLEDIRKDVLERVLYGFIHCSYFLPMMVVNSEPLDTDTRLNGSDEEFAAFFANYGGEEGTTLLTDMVEDLVELGCLVTQNKFLL